MSDGIRFGNPKPSGPTGDDYKTAWENLSKQINEKLAEARRLDEIDAYNGKPGSRASQYETFQNMMNDCGKNLTPVNPKPGFDNSLKNTNYDKSANQANTPRPSMPMYRERPEEFYKQPRLQDKLKNMRLPYLFEGRPVAVKLEPLGVTRQQVYREGFERAERLVDGDKDRGYGSDLRSHYQEMCVNAATTDEFLKCHAKVRYEYPDAATGIKELDESFREAAKERPQYDVQWDFPGSGTVKTGSVQIATVLRDGEPWMAINFEAAQMQKEKVRTKEAETVQVKDTINIQRQEFLNRYKYDSGARNYNTDVVRQVMNKGNGIEENSLRTATKTQSVERDR